jgi:hypothetical protein
MATESGWDVGCFVVLVIGAAMITYGVPAGQAVLLALPAVALTGALLRRHYAAAV